MAFFLPSSVSIAAVGSPATGVLIRKDAIQRFRHTCQRPTARRATGHPSDWPAGQPRRGLPQKNSSSPSYLPVNTPSRPIAPAWAFCAWARPMAMTAWRPPAGEHSSPAAFCYPTTARPAGPGWVLSGAWRRRPGQRPGLRHKRIGEISSGATGRLRAGPILVFERFSR